MRIVFFLFLIVTGLAAGEITLINGETYHHAEILHSDRVGIFIRGWRNGAFTLRFIPYGKLSPESYHTLTLSDNGIGNPVIQRIRQEIRRIIRAEREIRKTDDRSLWHKFFLLPGLPHDITLNSEEIYGNGTVGNAGQGAFSTENFNYGRIYIPGLFIPQGNSWYGTVYPTIRVIYYYGSALPCCTLDPASALQLNGSGVQ